MMTYAIDGYIPYLDIKKHTEIDRYMFYPWMIMTK